MSGTPVFEHTLVLRHVSDSAPARFMVVRLSDGKSTEPLSVPSPVGYSVAGRPRSDLLTELKWYLEKYIEFPFAPQVEHAERVLDSLKRWGEAAFGELFSSGVGQSLYEAAERNGLDRLNIQISSDDPRVLGWPWECLLDPRVGQLGQLCRLERRLNHVHDVRPCSPLPSDRLNILLVTARPYARDVPYLSVSRPLLSAIDTFQLPLQVTLLRPPTFQTLREHLTQRPRFYHVVHSDGHGSYGPATSEVSAYTLRGPSGQLVFEDEAAAPFGVDASRLSVLLRESAVPLVVLNACQSAMIDQRADSPFASTAASLIQAGCHSVVAMSYSLNVSAAQLFLPAFYRRLASCGSVAEAVRAGRQELFLEKNRQCQRGVCQLEDWVVPVLYQQGAVGSSLAPAKPRSSPPTGLPHHPNTQFVGRDAWFLRVERELRRPIPMILLQGLRGIGKTALMGAYLRWFAATTPTGECRQYDAASFSTLRELLTAILRDVVGSDPNRSEARTIELLHERFAERPWLIAIDRADRFDGSNGPNHPQSVSADERNYFQAILRSCRGGPSRWMAASTSDFEWLESERHVLEVQGLEDDESKDLCDRVVANVGKRAKLKDSEVATARLMSDGHPLAILASVAGVASAEPNDNLDTSSFLQTLDGRSSDYRSQLYHPVYAALREMPLPALSVLAALAWFRNRMTSMLITMMDMALERKTDPREIEVQLELLRTKGLVGAPDAAGIRTVHPALFDCMRAILPQMDSAERDRWANAFVSVTASLMGAALSNPDRASFRGATILLAPSTGLARAEASRLKLKDAESIFSDMDYRIAAVGPRMDDAALATPVDLDAHNASRSADGPVGNVDRAIVTLHNQSLQLFWSGRHAEAEVELQRAIAMARNLPKRLSDLATTSGVIKMNGGDLVAAEIQGQSALSAAGSDPGRQAGAYRLLGMICMRKSALVAAEVWLNKALHIWEAAGDDRRTAQICCILADVMLRSGDAQRALPLAQRALAMANAVGDLVEAAAAKRRLGRVAMSKGEFDEAESYFLSALNVAESWEGTEGEAFLYRMLQELATTQGDAEKAERWFGKRLESAERRQLHGDVGQCLLERACTRTIKGNDESARRDLNGAVEAFQRAGMMVDAAKAMHNLAVLLLKAHFDAPSAASLGTFIDASIRAIRSVKATGDETASSEGLQRLREFVLRLSPDERDRVLKAWEDAGCAPKRRRGLLGWLREPGSE